MIIGMSTASFYNKLYTEQTIVPMAKMGVKNIEVFLSGNSEYKKPFVKDLKKRTDDLGINIYSVHALSLQFEPQLFSKHKRQKADSMEIYKRVLEAGEELEASVYVFHGPGNVKKAKKLRINYERTGECITEAADMAAAYGLKFSYENVHWCWYERPDFAKKVIPFVKSDNLYFTLDLKQAGQSGYSPIEYIQDMGKRLINVHLCDYAIVKDRGIMPMLPFAGSLNYDELKAALKKIDYKGGMIIEVYASNYDNFEELEENFKKINGFFQID